jgi:hypothetical protein
MQGEILIMKLIHTKIIDDHEIIIGIGSPSIDPVETTKKVSEKIKDTDSYKFIELRKNEIKSKMVSAFKSKQNADNAKDKNEAKKHSDDYIFRMGQVKELESEIKTKLPELEKNRYDLATSEAVYFDRKPNEHLKTDEEAEAIENKMVAATQNGSVLKLDETEIIDNRGVVYWKESPWTKTVIEKIGVEIPTAGIIEKDLTELQRVEIAEKLEESRIEVLTAAEKTAEKAARIEQAAAEADAMRGKLEIQGVTDALTQAQSWYNEQVAIIESKYS